MPNLNSKSRRLHETNNTLADNIRKASVELLQRRFSEAVDLASQTNQARWNIKSPSIIALHELFDDIHDEIAGHADMIAERLTLGGQAYGTARAASECSYLNEYPLEASKQGDHIETVSATLAAFGKSAREASKEIWVVRRSGHIRPLTGDFTRDR